jgi:hypothetical protein
MVLFLPLFVFMPELTLRGMESDMDAVIDAFGKNKQVKISVLDLVCRDDWIGNSTGCGSSVSSAGGGDYYRDRCVSTKGLAIRDPAPRVFFPDNFGTCFYEIISLSFP